MTLPTHTYPRFRDRLNVSVPIVLIVLFALFTLFSPAALFAQKPDDPGMVKFRGAAFPIAEEAGEVTVVVKRLRGSTGEVSIDYATTEGTATADEDYVPTEGTLTWDDGDRSDKTFTVEILDDDADEGQETFGVVLENPQGGVEISSPSTAVVRIKPSDREDDEGEDDEGDDEPAAGEVKLTSASFPAFESDGEAEVTVEREDGSAGEVSVDFSTMPGSAEADVDYTPTAGTLTWADGEEGEKTILVPVIDDAEEEDMETFSIFLTNVVGDAELGRDVASVSIVDDDGGEGECVPDDETLCLGDGRFQVTGTWTDFAGVSGPFHWVPATDDSGFAWFFDESNVEFLLKVLDGCSLNGHYWVFYAATTNVAFTVEVTDLETGDVETYENPLGNIPLSTTDVTAFPGCE